MRHPVNKVFITQGFGENPANYAKFGYLGHNGLDYRAFNPDGNRCYTGGKSEVFAPHNGIVIENAYDAEGYGWYVKIENSVEGSILAHFSEQCVRKVGESVNEGDFLAFQGTTGNSTGIHLHHGYYRHPRNRQNGYGGMIDQTPYLGTVSPVDNEGKLAECELHKNNLQTQVNGLLKDLEILKGQLSDAETQKGTLSGRIQELTTQNEDLSSQLGSTRSELEVANASLKRVQTALEEELTDQHDWADIAEKEQNAHKETKDQLNDFIFELEEQLKLSHSSDDVQTKISKILGSLSKQLEAKVVIKGLSDFKNIIRLFGVTLIKS